MYKVSCAGENNIFLFLLPLSLFHADILSCWCFAVLNTNICHEKEPSLGNRLMATDCLYTCVTGNVGMKAKSYALKSWVSLRWFRMKKRQWKRHWQTTFYAFFLLRLALIIIEVELSARYITIYRAYKNTATEQHINSPFCQVISSLWIKFSALRGLYW